MPSKFRLRRPPAVMLAILIALLLFSAAADAQAKRRRRAPVRPILPTTTLPAGEPQIISRADDYSDPNSQVVAQPVSTPVPATDDPARSIEELEQRIKGLEAAKGSTKDDGQKRLLLNLDILTRAEDRSAALRKQLFDIIDKENSIKTRLEGIDNELRPEAIERSTALVGSLRPEDLRATRKRSLESEKANLESLLAQIQATHTSLDQTLQRSEALVEKLRNKLEKDIEAALVDDDSQKP